MKVCNKCKKQLASNFFSIKLRNKDGLRARCKKCEYIDFKNWVEQNREKYLLIKLNIRNKNKTLYRFYAKRARYIARSSNPQGRHTLFGWEALKKKYSHKCLKCKLREPEIKLTPDHIIPTSKGGSDYIENIQPLCMKCNQIKNNKIILYA